MKLSIIFPWVAAFALLQICPAEPVFGAPANANTVIPYKQLDQYCQFADDVDHSRVEIRVCIESTDQRVAPSNIFLTIHSATRGNIPVALGVDGLVAHFPHGKDLRDENAPIVSNQPKGSLRMVVSMRLAMPDALAFRYRRLGDGVLEINRAIAARAGWLSFVTPKAKGVKFYFPKSSAGKKIVIINSASGAKEYAADKDGLVQLKLEKPLLAENPEVKLPKNLTGLFLILTAEATNLATLALGRLLKEYRRFVNTGPQKMRICPGSKQNSPGSSY